MMYILLFHFLNICSQEDLWQIACAYQNSLNDSKKIPFYSEDEWEKLSPENQNAIRNILICKHAEVRHAPIHMLQLKLFNSSVKGLNEAITYSLKADSNSVSIQIPSNPLFYWMLETNGKFLTNPHQGEWIYSHHDDGHYVYSVSQEQRIVIPFIVASYANNELCVRIRETYECENNILSLSNSQGKKDSFIPLRNVHSICPLEARIYDHLEYLPALTRSDSAGLLITLKNGLQMVWNRKEQQLYPVGFCRQQNPEEDSYVYCKRMHDYLYTLKKPSQGFQRLYFKKFIWKTPHQWYWNSIKSRLYNGIKKLFIAGAIGWGIWRGNLFYKDMCMYQEKYNTELESFKNKLSQKNIPVPSILGLKKL